ncbi:hypothetical protein GON09_001061 [Rhodococcus sp. B50]|nr:hypothetical protein [Rhodococcus sp. B50]
MPPRRRFGRRQSNKARQVLVWLLSKPDDWRTRADSIAAQSPKEGRDAIRSALRELADLGYLVREKIQNELGQWITIQTVCERPVADPAPENPTRGGADIGEPGALSSTDTPRTETDRTPRVAKAPLSPAVVELAAACRRAGLTATFVYLKPDAAAAIEALVSTYGVPALVSAAKSVHRPGNPMRLAHGWLPLWRSLPTPRVVQPKCDDCDEYGWLPDDELGRAVRCGCRAAAA